MIHTIGVRPADVLIILPEYQGRCAIVDSATEIVNRLAPKGLLSFTFLRYPEEDPRYMISLDNAVSDPAVVSHAKFLSKGAPISSSTRGLTAHYDYMDSAKSFDLRMRMLQHWLEQESQDEWYEMDRPDYTFSKADTLGVYLNPFPHVDRLDTGSVGHCDNVACVQLTKLEEFASKRHIELARWFWKLGFEFLSRRAQAAGRSETEFEKIEQAYCVGYDAIRELELLMINNPEEAKLPIPELNLGNKHLNFKNLGIHIPLSERERILYKFLIENPKGIRRQELAEFRPELRHLFMEVNPNLDKAELKRRVKAQLDCWMYTDSLRETVSQINQRLMPFDSIDGMKSWRVSMVGDRFMLNRFAKSHI